MPAALLMVVSVVAGCCIATQGPINAALARGIGSPLTAALISFAAGTVALALVFGVLVGPSGVSPGWRTVPAWIFVAGGLLGLVYITSATFIVPRLGAATFLTLAIAGQTLAGLVLDHFGLFGLTEHALSPGRMLAVCLIVGGVVLTRLS